MIDIIFSSLILEDYWSQYKWFTNNWFTKKLVADPGFHFNQKKKKNNWFALYKVDAWIFLL